MVPCRERRCKRPEAPTRATGIIGSGFAPAWPISCCDNRLLEDLLIGYYICLGDPLVLADSATGLPFDTL